MPKVNDKFVVEKQLSLPFKRALEISFKSLKIRFWRSMITAAGIFLGIAFLTTVLTQWLMQAPVPVKVGPGLVSLSGEINGPGDFEVWHEIPVSEGLAAGIPKEVIDEVKPVNGKFHLRDIVQGIIDVKHNEKRLAEAKAEMAALEKVNKSFYSDKNADKDIYVEDAIKEGVPETIAKRLAGEGRIFKGAALAEAIKAQPDVIKKWERRAKRKAIFNKVSQSSVDALSKKYSITLADLIESGRGFAPNADKSNIRIVNYKDKERRIHINLNEDKDAPKKLVLKDGDNVIIADRNSYYRMIWLVVMSLLVCTVGITNSMLMAVTERFKEIGTMKCLGATDGFVVTLFMLEASMQGIVASVLGWLLGFVSMILVAGFTRGWEVVGMITPSAVIIQFFIAVGIGMLLTIVATIAPALRAAAMPAAIALRSEI